MADESVRLCTAVTDLSVWKFDLVLCRYLRFPRDEDPGGHPALPYDAKWDDFTRLERVATALWCTGRSRLVPVRCG
mgnify:CR=1 FL=1